MPSPGTGILFAMISRRAATSLMSGIRIGQFPESKTANLWSEPSRSPAYIATPAQAGYLLSYFFYTVLPRLDSRKPRRRSSGRARR